MMITVALSQCVVVVLVALGDHGDHPARRVELGRLDRPAGVSDHQPQSLAPHGVPQLGARQRTQVAQQDYRREDQRHRGGDQGPAQDGPLDELAGLRALTERLRERLPVLLRRGQRLAGLGELHVRHQAPDPDDGAHAQREEGHGHGDAERQVDRSTASTETLTGSPM